MASCYDCKYCTIDKFYEQRCHYPQHPVTEFHISGKLRKYDDEVCEHHKESKNDSNN